TSSTPTRYSSITTLPGIPEHDALIAGALLRRLFAFDLLGVDALRDVRRLPGKVVIDEYRVGVEDVIRVHITDITDRIAHDRLVIELRLRRDLTGDDHHVRFDHGFAGHAAGAILRQAGVEH